jgi:prolyl-tRNA synthetase
MKDGYSFHTDEESLKKTYQDMYQAYSNMMRRSGLKFRPVEADSGAIGGSGSTEFMILADAGEDEVLYTEDGQYSANVEKAVSLPPDAEPSPFTTYEKRDTPNTPTIDSLAKFLKCSPTQIVKNVLYQAIYDNGMTVLVLVSIRGDQDVNEVKLNNELVRQAEQYNAKTLLSLTVPDAAAQQKWASKPLPLGYIAPDLPDNYIQQVIDELEQKFTQEDVEQRATEIWQRKGSPQQDWGGQEADYLQAERELEQGFTQEDVEQQAKEIWQRKGSPQQDWGGQEADYLQAERELVEKIENKKSSISPEQQLNHKFLRLVDKTVVELKNFVTGSNESGYHVVGANWGEQFQLPKLEVDLRKAKIGDRAIHDLSQTLQSARGIEAGHIFQLGTKYSKAMGATFTSESGEELPLYMGCYGVGVSRMAQAAVEQSYDKDGIIWPVAIAPYHAIICVPNVGDAAQMEVAEKLYTQLNQAGIETLFDDRNERAGVKFKDADLIGIPYRIVTGRSLKDGKVEVVERATKKAEEISIDEVLPTLKQWIDTALK